ncbi:MAG TPA: putative zinc-binding metallopeptidase [Pirellulales bacterium]|nr:putative zinc-binding metallopeptidase [Pirellulales bacterium]
MKSRPNARPRPSSGGRKAGPSWADFDDDALLDLRLCDLDLRLEGTELEARINRLYAELEARSIAMRPHCWLSEEWFSPDGVPGIALPFYLAHKRLAALEDRMMLDVEGGTAEACLRILRHEAGHALDTAFRLHRRSDWRRVFGKASKPYPDHYQPRPHSRRYVLHLNSWYAQSHPSEDFAETFAVWLSPDSDWRRDYADWPARRKLDYVDQLMTALAGEKPSVRARRHVEPLSEIRKTLRTHYEEKRARFIAGHGQVYDRGLRRLFSPAPGRATQEAAADFLRRARPELRRVVSDMTGELEYTIDQVLQEMIMRCRHLRLYRQYGQRKSEEEAASLLAQQTRNFLENGQHRFAL